MDGKDSPGVNLSEAIGEVRRELEKAVLDGRDSPIAFKAGPVEMEFQILVDRTVGTDAGVRVWVVSVGARGEATRSSSHTLKVTLTPTDRHGDDILVGEIDRN